MKTTKLITALTLSLLAAVSPEEAAKLGTSLTPLGGEKAGNADGSIPAWTGGLPRDAATALPGGFLEDPFASEQPLFTITAQNLEQYRDKLAEGQIALFKRYPETFKMAAYPSHRSAAVPAEIAEAARKSAVSTSLLDGGNGLKGFAESRYYAFPIPQSGLEVIWNHITRYRGGNLQRHMVQAAPQANGSYSLVHFEDEVAFPTGMSGLDAKKAENALLFFKQRVTAPARLAGNVLLVHDSLDQISEPRMAWLYNAGQRRVRRAPQVAYDGPGTASDGMRTSDNFDMFNGAPDRYDWKLVGKRELYIPYNNYRIASPKLKYADILKAGHTNQELARYELHRVWEVEATLKAGERNIYAKRRFFIDEDTWQIAASELYDGRGPVLARLQLLRGTLLASRGDTAAAQTMLRAGVEEAEACEDAYLLFGYLGLAELACAQNDDEGAQQLLRRAERQMQWLHVPEVRYREMLQLAQGGLWLRQGEADKARQAFLRVCQRLEQERLLAPSGFYDLLPRARLCLAQADLALGQTASALAALQTLHDDCRRSGHHSLATRVRLSQAEALHLAGRETEAEALLRLAVGEAERQAQLQPLLALQQRQPDWLAEHPAWPAHLLQSAGATGGATTPGEALLSKRELAVLGLIAQGHSNQQIADSLYISLHTVKTHARRINVKLGVQRRTQAVARAKAEGWLG